MMIRKTFLLMAGATLGFCQAELAVSGEFATCVGAQEEGTELSCAVQDRNGNPISLPENSIGAMYGANWKLVQVVKSARDNNQNPRKGNVNIFYFDKP